MGSFYFRCFFSKGPHSLCRPDAGRSETSEPSPFMLLHHLFMTARPYIMQERCGSDTCHFTGPSLEAKSPKGKRTILHLYLFPHSPSSQFRFSVTVSPLRNPPEQPGDSPRIHRLSTAHVPAITQTDTYPHEPYISSVHQLVFWNGIVRATLRILVR